MNLMFRCLQQGITHRFATGSYPEQAQGRADFENEIAAPMHRPELLLHSAS